VKAFDCHSGGNTCEAHEKRLFVHAGKLTFSPSQVKYSHLYHLIRKCERGHHWAHPLQRRTVSLYVFFSIGRVPFLAQSLPVLVWVVRGACGHVNEFGMKRGRMMRPTWADRTQRWS